MSKRSRGRPRREGVERGATGKIKTGVYLVEQSKASAKAAEDIHSLARWRAARIIVERMLQEPKLASPLGRMFLLGVPIKISKAEFEAGVRFGQILDAYDRVVLGINRDPKAQDINGARGRALREGPGEDEVNRAISNFSHAEQALFDVREALVRMADGVEIPLGPGADLVNATKALVRGDDWERRAAFAVVGLKALARYWSLDGVQETKIRRAGERLNFAPEGRVRSFDISYG